MANVSDKPKHVKVTVRYVIWDNAVAALIFIHCIKATVFVSVPLGLLKLQHLKKARYVFKVALAPLQIKTALQDV